MEKEFLISIIVPAYNSESSIENVLKGLADQTYKEIEVIVVDDASEDNTYQIAKNFANTHAQFAIYKNNRNMGAGKTKNFALSKCKGEYIGFCDADDYVPKDYYERLYNAIKESSAELAVCNLSLVFEDGHIEPLSLMQNSIVLRNNPRNYRHIPTKQKDPFVIPNEILTGFWADASAPTMLFKRELITRYPFYDVICDDIPAVIPSVVSAKKIVYVPNLYYGYIQRKGSLERMSVFSRRRLYIADAIGLVLERLPNNVDQSILQCIICNHMFASFVSMLRQIPLEERQCLFQELYNHVIRYPVLHKYLAYENNPFIHLTIRTYPEHLHELYIEALQRFVAGDINALIETVSRGEGQITDVKPLVSIVIPVYNGANYLREAINSALCQDYPEIEIIVVNDGSNDNDATETIAKSFGNRIRYISKPNGGVSTALNTGIKAMKGEYFSWLSHDDLYKVNKVSRQVTTVLTQNDRTNIVISGYEAFDNANGKILMVSKPLDLYTQEQLAEPLFGVFHGLINGCAMLIHKSHFDRVGLFDESLKTTQDYDMWFRMLRGQKVVFINDVLLSSRSHAAQESKVGYHQKNSFDLWKGMIDQTTVEERINMSGSEKAFYYDVYNFLKNNTCFFDAALYALKHYFAIQRHEFGIYTAISKTLPTKCIKHYKKQFNSQLYNELSEFKGVPLEMQEKLYQLMREWSARKTIITVARSSSCKTKRIFVELNLHYPMISIEINENNTYSIIPDGKDAYKLQLPVSLKPGLLIMLLMMLNTKMIIISLDTELLRMWHTWKIHLQNYVDCPTGFILEADFNSNRHIMRCVSNSQFVIAYDEKTNMAYRSIYKNMIYPCVDDIINIIEGHKIEYVHAEKNDLNKTLLLYAFSDDENCLIIEYGNNNCSKQVENRDFNEAELMRNTISWKITKPLRYIRTVMLRLKRRNAIKKEK